MELEFTTEPLLNPALTTCPLWGKGEPIWIHSQKEDDIAASLASGLSLKRGVRSCGDKLYVKTQSREAF